MTLRNVSLSRFRASSLDVRLFVPVFDADTRNNLQYS